MVKFTPTLRACAGQIQQSLICPLLRSYAYGGEMDIEIKVVELPDFMDFV